MYFTPFEDGGDELLFESESSSVLFLKWEFNGSLVVVALGTGRGRRGEPANKNAHAVAVALTLTLARAAPDPPGPRARPGRRAADCRAAAYSRRSGSFQLSSTYHGGVFTAGRRCRASAARTGGGFAGRRKGINYVKRVNFPIPSRMRLAHKRRRRKVEGEEE